MQKTKEVIITAFAFMNQKIMIVENESTKPCKEKRQLGVCGVFALSRARRFRQNRSSVEVGQIAVFLYFI
jgi:hypothetical protein